MSVVRRLHSLWVPHLIRFWSNDPSKPEHHDFLWLAPLPADALLDVPRDLSAGVQLLQYDITVAVFAIKPTDGRFWVPPKPNPHRIPIIRVGRIPIILTWLSTGIPDRPEASGNSRLNARFEIRRMVASYTLRHRPAEHWPRSHCSLMLPCRLLADCRAVTKAPLNIEHSSISDPVWV